MNVGSEQRPVGMGDLPPFEDWSLNQLEEHVAGKHLTSDLRNYLGNAWRVVGRSDHFDPGQVSSACAGFISCEPPPQAAVELGRKLAKEFGW